MNEDTLAALGAQTDKALRKVENIFVTGCTCKSRTTGTTELLHTQTHTNAFSTADKSL